MQGFTLKGALQKGDKVRINLSGTVRDFTALDVVPREMGLSEKDTFFSQLRSNVHNHKISEYGSGWIIIDTEEVGLIPKNTFAADYKQPRPIARRISNCIRGIYISHSCPSE